MFILESNYYEKFIIIDLTKENRSVCRVEVPIKTTSPHCIFTMGEEQIRHTITKIFGLYLEQQKQKKVHDVEGLTSVLNTFENVLNNI